MEHGIIVILEILSDSMMVIGSTQKEEVQYIKERTPPIVGLFLRK